ncbi:MAG: polysaccharide deacetylase family protein [Candidatus Binatia bacterium]
MGNQLALPGRPMLLAAFAVSAIVLFSFTAAAAPPSSDLRVPILVYHRFGRVVADSMTVTTEVFESQLQYLEANGYAVIPLRQFVDYRLGRGPSPPPHSLVITADDGHGSVYTEMLPLVTRYRIPVTLFIYPSAISRADYALTWEQLRKLHGTGLFEIQSHTYWHPNFRKEKKRLTSGEYEQLVATQLTRSRERLHRELGVTVDMLAWPFGIFDDDLIRQAVRAGYVAAFSLERRHASTRDNLMALPRYLMTNGDRGRAFERLLTGGRAEPRALSQPQGQTPILLGWVRP